MVIQPAGSEPAIFGVAEQLTPFLRARNELNLNEIYVGQVILPSQDRRARAFVKVFPPEARNQLVYNEVVGHSLALQCGLPSPLTFPCACPVALLRQASRLVMAAGSVSPYVLGVASVDGNLKALRQSGSSSAAVWADIMNWPPVARVAVFDELMGNDDRHLENLIRCGPHEYTIIDNERILFGEPWFTLDLNQLRTRRCDANVLADTIAEGTDEVMRQRMIHIAQRLVMETTLTVPTVATSIEHMCGAQSGTTARLVEMLNLRRSLLPTLMQWHMEKGDLFQASTNR